MSVVASNIKYIRNKQGLSQAELAEKLRLTRNQINSYENNLSQPSIDALKKISTYFKISIDILVSIPLNKSNLKQLTEQEELRLSNLPR